MFQSDLALATASFNPLYCCSLNSDDKIDPLIALTSSRAHGGTLVFWKRNLDPFVTIFDVTSSRILVFLLNVPGYPMTVHISIYLPTSGLENEFVEELSNLEVAIEELTEKYPSASFFIRGDANSSVHPRSGNKRDFLFSFFCDKLGLKSSEIGHPTYHHFIGHTSSSIDVILQKNKH